MYCAQCGTQLTPEARFCSVCGTPRGGTNASEASVTVSPTAPAAPTAVTEASLTRPGGSELTGIVLLLAPLISTALIILWVGNMNLLQGPASTLMGLMVATVLGTAVLAAVEASQIGVGSPRDLDKRGKKRSGPIAWFFLVTLLWLIGYPMYLFWRSRYGRKNLIVGGIVVALTFVGTAGVFGTAIERSREGLLGHLNDAQKEIAALANPVPASQPRNAPALQVPTVDIRTLTKTPGWGLPKALPIPDEFARYRGRPWDLLREPEFAAAFAAIRPTLPDLEWVRSLKLVASENVLSNYWEGLEPTETKQVIIAGGCKPYECNDNTMWIGFNPKTKACVVRVVIDKEVDWYGASDFWISSTLTDYAKGWTRDCPLGCRAVGSKPPP